MSKPKAIVPRRPEVSVAILVIGGIAYTALCGPSIQQRGYPPIDPIWWAVTFLWPFPLLLSCWFDTWSFPTRRTQLWAYALATAFFNAGTPVTIVPKHVNPCEMLGMTAFFFGPMHVAVTFALEACVQGVLGQWRTVVSAPPPADRQPRFSLLAWTYLHLVLCAGIGFPIAFRGCVVGSLQKRGAEAAETDWKTGNASVYAHIESISVHGALVEYEIDRDTGLWIRRSMGHSEFRNSYNRRMREILNEDDSALRELKASIPRPKAVAELLSSPILSEVTEFPYELTPSIVLFRKGTISRWGSTMSSGDDSLSIATEGRLLGIGPGAQPVFVAIDRPRKGFVVVRNGTTWVGVFRNDGRILASASSFK